ncbi:MAG: hypothetical protein HYU83_03450, partial [Chloroflexi bacterium]|nr:hypothetical protein [Chloroflexota bacterium]
MVKDSLGRMVEKPRYGGVYTTVPSAGLTGFDPVFLSGTAQQVQIQTHDELVQLDWKRGPTGTNEISASFSLAPMTLKTGMLAESWEVPDDSTIIYHIRKGVHFALDPNSEASRLVGGRELTAADVAYSINRNFEDLPGSDSRIRNLPVEWPVSVTAPDKYTVVVKTNPGYAQNALLYTSDVTKIYPPEPVKKYGDLRDWKNNVGSGPFIMKDYVPGSTVTFVRNSNYWQHDLFFPENQLPYIDGVKYVYVTDKSTVMAGLRSGKIDGLHPQFLKFIAEDVKTLTQSNPEMKFRRVLSERPQAVNFVFRDPSQPW